MSDKKFRNFALGEQLLAAGWQPLPTRASEERSPEEWRNYYCNAPAIGRVCWTVKTALRAFMSTCKSGR